MINKKNALTRDVTQQTAQNAILRSEDGSNSKNSLLTSPYYFQPQEASKPIAIGPNRVLISLLVAPRRCGKTTLLSAIYREFANVMGNEFEMEPYHMEEDQIHKLKENQDTLEAFTNVPYFKEGLAPSDALETYEFLIYKKDHPRICFILRFIDVPGEWVEDHPEAMKILIENADILYFPINSPALVEHGGKYNQEFNNSDCIIQLTNCLKDESLKSKRRLLLFVPIKSEKYYWDFITGKNKNALTDLNSEVVNSYREIIESVKANRILQNNTSIAITPIMTVGGLRFDQFVPIASSDPSGTAMSKDTYNRILGYITERNGYRPTFCEQPLLYSLRFIRGQMISEVKKAGLLTFIWDIKDLGFMKALHYAFHDPLIETITAQTKTANFSLFKSVEDYQRTEKYDASPSEMQYPEGLFIDNKILGYSIEHNPEEIFK